MRPASIGVLVAASWLTVATIAGAEEAGLGWHGEPMPEGLVRAEAEGEYRWKTDDSIMVYVPAGSFVMGNDEGPGNERPEHDVVLDAFYIDKFEVTWAQWRRSGLPTPVGIDGKAIPDHKPFWGRGDKIPVSYIDWNDAHAYAGWSGKRLPTEAEWEKAARGTDGRLYPWGDSPPTYEHAIWNDHPIGEDQPGEVDCCPAGVSPYGAHNMAGNVFEWCEDSYDRRVYAREPRRNPVFRSDETRLRVMRGGSFVFGIDELRAAQRTRQDLEEGQDYVGIRMALSAIPTAEAP